MPRDTGSAWGQTILFFPFAKIRLHPRITPLFEPRTNDPRIASIHADKSKQSGNLKDFGHNMLIDTNRLNM